MNADSGGSPPTVYLDDYGDGAAAPSHVNSLKSLIRGRMHIALTLAAVLGILFAAAGYLSVRPSYRSDATVTVKTIRKSPFGDETNVAHALESLKAEQIGRIRSAQVLDTARRDEEFQRKTEGLYDDVEGLEKFSWKLSTFHRRSDPIIQLGFEDDEQDVAHAGMRLIVEAYMDLIREDNRKEYLDQIESLRTEVHNLSTEISTYQNQINSYVNEFGTSDLSSLMATKSGRMEMYQNRLDAVNQAIQSMGGSRDGNDPNAAPAMPNAEAQLDMAVRSDAQLAALVKARDLIQTELDQSSWGPGHDFYKVRQSNIDRLNQQIQDRLEVVQAGGGSMDGAESGAGGSLLNGLAPTVEGLLAQREFLERQIMNMQAEIREISTASSVVFNLEGKINSRNASITTNENQIRNLEVWSRSELPISSSEANMPVYPSNSGSKMKMAIMGFGGGCISGFAIVMLMGLVDSRVRRADDVVDAIPAAKLLGMLPTLPENLKDRQIAQLTCSSVHHIRTLLQVATASDRRVITFTSPAAGSGKTSVTLAMGLSFAASRSRTLLIDLDIISGEMTRRCTDLVRSMLGTVLHEKGLITAERMREAEKASQSTGQRLDDLIVERGYVSREDMDAIIDLGGPESIGLLDACGDSPIEDCVSPTGIPGLHVLPVGSASPEEAGSLSPGEVEDLIARAREQYDVVLLDSGPLLGSLEAAIAATHSTGVVLVVSRGDDRKLTSEVISRIESIRANLLGLVFNHAVIEDLERSSYWVTSSVQHRKSDPEQGEGMVPRKAARALGPLGAAVARYTQIKQRRVGPTKRKSTKGGINLAS